MKTSGLLLLVSIVSGFFFTSCHDDDVTDGREFLSPEGMTFEGGGLSITFESADSVCFYPLSYPYESSGKARYLYRGHTIEILNPYGRRLPPEQVEKAYFLDFVGELNSSDKLEHIRFFFIGPGEHLQSIGNDVTLWRVKDN